MVGPRSESRELLPSRTPLQWKDPTGSDQRPPHALVQHGRSMCRSLDPAPDDAEQRVRFLQARFYGQPFPAVAILACAGSPRSKCPARWGGSSSNSTRLSRCRTDLTNSAVLDFTEPAAHHRGFLAIAFAAACNQHNTISSRVSRDASNARTPHLKCLSSSPRISGGSPWVR